VTLNANQCRGDNNLAIGRTSSGTLKFFSPTKMDNCVWMHTEDFSGHQLINQPQFAALSAGIDLTMTDSCYVPAYCSKWHEKNNELQVAGDWWKIQVTDDGYGRKLPVVMRTIKMALEMTRLIRLLIARRCLSWW
jgi:hypothetical protein